MAHPNCDDSNNEISRSYKEKAAQARLLRRRIARDGDTRDRI